LDLEALKLRYERSHTPVEQRRFHLIWLVVSGKTLKEAAHLLDYDYQYAWVLLQLYNREGPEALAPRKTGPKPKTRAAFNARLSLELREELRKALNEPPPDGGLWTGPKVAAWITQRTGGKTCPQVAWGWLKRLGFSKVHPRPRHRDASAEEQEAFKKNSRKRWFA
jgi:transposase